MTHRNIGDGSYCFPKKAAGPPVLHGKAALPQCFYTLRSDQYFMALLNNRKPCLPAKLRFRHPRLFGGVLYGQQILPDQTDQHGKFTFRTSLRTAFRTSYRQAFPQPSHPASSSYLLVSVCLPLSGFSQSYCKSSISLS